MPGVGGVVVVVVVVVVVGVGGRDGVMSINFMTIEPTITRATTNATEAHQQSLRLLWLVYREACSSCCLPMFTSVWTRSMLSSMVPAKIHNSNTFY